MKYAEVEAMLYNYKLLKASIENQRLKLKNIDIEFEYEYGMNSIAAGDGVSSGMVSKPTEKSALENFEKKNQMKKELEKQIRLDENKIQMLDNALNALSELERTIITMFYIDNMEWWRVAGKVSYSEGWCKEKRKESINRILKLMENSQA